MRYKMYIKTKVFCFFSIIMLTKRIVSLELFHLSKKLSKIHYIRGCGCHIKKIKPNEHKIN